MRPFDFYLRTRVVFGEGTFERLGELSRELGFTTALIVSDPGIVATGLVAKASADAARRGHRVGRCSTSSTPTPTARWWRRAAPWPHGRASTGIVALGGGSSLDCAKGINFVLTNGGTMRDYKGHDKAARPMLPMIGVPTTAGTGSDAQSYAIISDPVTHEKMACGAAGAAFRIAILDPALTVSQPRAADGDRRLRRALARGRVVRDGPADDHLGSLRRRRLAAARSALRAGACGSGRPGGARGDAARRARGRHGHRAVDARRHARLRQPADGAPWHDARRGHLRHAPARRALERPRGGRTLRRPAAYRRSDAGGPPR